MTVANSGLIQGLVTVVLEMAGVAVAIFVIVKLLSRVGVRRGGVAIATVVVVGVLAAVITAEDVAHAGTAIANSHRAVGGTEDGIDHCFLEEGAQRFVPFVKWVRTQIPSRAIYAATTAGTPDLWCITLSLLPRLPAYGSARAQWLVAFGAIPPSMQAAIARHDPSVKVFVSGMAIQRLVVPR